MKYLVSLLFAGVLCVLPVCSFGIDSEVERLTTNYLDRISKMKFDGLSQYFEPGELSNLKDSLIDLLENKRLKNKRKFRAFLMDMLDLDSVDGLKKIPPDLLVEQLLSKQYKSGGSSSGIELTEYGILGSIEEGKTMVHVLTRQKYKMQTITFNELVVVSFTNTESGWRMMLPQDMKQLYSISK